MTGSLSELRRAFETATANVDKVSFTITTVPVDWDELDAILSIARAAGHLSGAALRRIEVPTQALQRLERAFSEIAVLDTDGADVLRLFFERDPVELDEAA